MITSNLEISLIDGNINIDNKTSDKSTETIDIAYYVEVHECIPNDYEQTDFLVVQNIKIFLSNEGYFDGSLNGYFDSKLENSIKDFQKAMGIRIDGIIGPTTYKTMQKYDSCTKESNTNFISCFNGDYKAYKACTSPYGSFTLEVPTTTVPVDTSNKIDCDDGGKMWHGDQGTLWNAQGRVITYENCDEHKAAKNQGYDYTEKPIPGVTPGVGLNGSTTTATATSSGPTITNLGSAISIAENQTSVVTVAATGSGSLTYALSGTDARVMSVNSSGVITLNSNANYEEKSSYSATVAVTDTNGTTSTALTVNVTDTSEDAIVDVLYVAAGGARDVTESDMIDAVDADISANNTIFTNSQVDITYNKRAFLDSTETFSVTNNNEMWATWLDSVDSKNKVKYGADYVVFFSGKVANPDPTDFSYRYGPYAGFNPNASLDTTIANTTNWSANAGGNLVVTYQYYSCNSFTGECGDPKVAATAHELGHNLNGNHSRTQITGAASGSGYNFGYQGSVKEDGFFTVMGYSGRAYEAGNDYGLDPTNTFSNPDINCTGEAGTSYTCGDEDEADMARYLNENKFKYQDALYRTNLNETTDSYSILSSAYFPLNDGATSTFTDGSNSKTFYTIKGADTTVSSTTYQTFKWCDDSTCNLSGSDHRIAFEIYVNSGNYYLKSQHLDRHYGLGTAGASVGITFSAPCLFMEKYQVLGDFADADCNSTVSSFDTSEGSSYNFHNYAAKELAYSSYGSYDTKQFLYTYQDREGDVIERYVFWLSDQVGIVKFLDSNDVLWRLTAVDSDGDGTDNTSDTDDDGDGVLDTADAFPLDPNASADADDDGIADGDE